LKYFLFDDERYPIQQIKFIKQMDLHEHIINDVYNKLECYINAKYTEEEQVEYYASSEYELHLDYLIQSWTSHIEKQFNYKIKYNEDFEYINKLFEYGDYLPYFDDEWLDDIFVRHILVTNVCLK
jgi:hypothetical protein